MDTYDTKEIEEELDRDYSSKVKPIKEEKTIDDNSIFMALDLDDTIVSDVKEEYNEKEIEDTNRIKKMYPVGVVDATYIIAENIKIRNVKLRPYRGQEEMHREEREPPAVSP